MKWALYQIDPKPMVIWGVDETPEHAKVRGEHRMSRVSVDPKNVRATVVRITDALALQIDRTGETKKGFKVKNDGKGDFLDVK